MTFSLSIFSFDDVCEYSCRDAYALSVSCRAGLPAGPSCFCIAPANDRYSVSFCVRVREAALGLYRLVKMMSQVTVSVFADWKQPAVKPRIKFAAIRVIAPVYRKIFAQVCHYRL